MIVERTYRQRCLVPFASVDEDVLVYRHRVRDREQEALVEAKKAPKLAEVDIERHGWPPDPLQRGEHQAGFWGYVVTHVVVVVVQAPPQPAVTRWMRPAIRASRRLKRTEIAFKAELDREAPERRPATDLECRAIGLGESVPCPFVACAHHLGIDVMRSGSLRVIYPHWEDGADDAEPTCSLAEAAKGEHTAAEMGRLLGVGVNRVLQIEAEAMAKIAARMGMRADELKRLLEAQRANDSE